eukprot:GHVU01034115.1.p1 GENE.GHVU01034115.1~~GHVU01034115.1.p1  ORF type:complete len:123 (-),score=6.17 GHVU01034115.1:104-472(-)
MKDAITDVADLYEGGEFAWKGTEDLTNPIVLAITLMRALIDHSSPYVMGIGQSVLHGESSLYVKETDGSYRQLSIGAARDDVSEPIPVVHQSKLQLVIAKKTGVWAARRCVWETGRFEASAI